MLKCTKTRQKVEKKPKTTMTTRPRKGERDSERERGVVGGQEQRP